MLKTIKLLWNDYEGRNAKKLPPPFRLFDMYNDPYEDNNLIPILFSSCPSDGLIASLTWEKIAEIRSKSSSTSLSAEYKQVVVSLLTYLQYKMHFFRHEGNN